MLCKGICKRKTECVYEIAHLIGALTLLPMYHSSFIRFPLTHRDRLNIRLIQLCCVYILCKFYFVYLL